MASLAAALLAGLALLMATGSAMAHPATTAHAAPSPAPQPGILEAGVPTLPAAAPSAAPDSTGLPPLAVAGALALGAIAVVIGRWPRQALAVGFVILLTIFAFENALHSVHHGFDAQQSEECAVAAVSAHLAAISVDGVVETALVLAIARTAAESELSSPPPRLLGPDQDRAPPVPTV